ncbi:MAG: T9SS type A sorting domain-containing protein [Paludibacter sp.]
MKRQILISIVLFFSLVSFSQFKGASGVYYLGSADTAIPTVKYANPNLSGAVCRFNWDSCEPSPGVFNWAFVDGEIQKAKAANKKISLQPLGLPAWMKTFPNVQVYYSIDKNQFHTTYGKVISNVIPWNPTYLDRVNNFIQQLALKYANDTTVSYVNAIGGQISRNMPDTVLIDTILKTRAAFWKAFPYNADTVAKKMLPVIDFYMNNFPNKPLWCSVDYVSFELKASGRTPNYLATLYTNYGISTYPDRFGLWREDIAGCTLYPPQTGNQWNILKNNPDRTGAQMIWSVQDGPTRMNTCGIVPNTKQEVMDSALNKGLNFGMRYIEIYGVDIDDSSLSQNIQNANAKLIVRGKQLGSTGVSELNADNVKVYPNPAGKIFSIELPNGMTNIKLVDIFGRIIIFRQNNQNPKVCIDCQYFTRGIYFLQLSNLNQEHYFYKIILSD